MALDYVGIAAYVLGMVGVGWWGMRRATTRGDYLVVGRRPAGQPHRVRGGQPGHPLTAASVPHTWEQRLAGVSA
jgi:hypothetical protein